MSASTKTKSFAGPDWRELLVNWPSPCPRCKQIGILRIEAAGWYECRICGHIFEPGRIARSGAELRREKDFWCSQNKEDKSVTLIAEDRRASTNQ